MRGMADTDLPTLTLLLGRLGRLNEAAVNDVCAQHGTTSAEVRVLLMLSHRPEGAASPSDIARFVVQTSGGLTATLRRLEADGHVERRPDPHDGRGRLVALTPAGRKSRDYRTPLSGREDGGSGRMPKQALLQQNLR